MTTSRNGLRAFLAVSALLASVSAGSQQLHGFPPENSTTSSISWLPCTSELNLPEFLQCAKYSVPIDWESPHGEHFDLGLVKLPAAASNSTIPKVGTLFAIPGGPGGPASDVVTQIALGIKSEAFLSSFDVIGLDPRGVGRSNQIQCNTSIQTERVSMYPQNEEELERMRDKNKRFGESCWELTGSLLEHVDTISTAKDYEAVRIALGNEPINIVAFSYGTVVGAQYAALFPDNLRSLALDAVIQHSQAESTNSFIEATSYALGFSRFLAWASNDTASALKGQDVRLLWNELLVNASTTPIPAPLCNNTNCRSDVNSEELLFNAQSYLVYSGKEVGLGSSWQILASALRNASNGDASTLSTVIADPTRGAAVATSCLDWTQDTSSSLADNLAQQRMMQEYAPLTQGHSQLWSLQHQCLGWPINAVNPPRKLDIKTNTTILMTHSTRDGLSGLPWALGMLEEITNKVLVLRDGDGHTSTPLAGETAETIIRYLITGKAPEDGLVLQS